MLLWRRWLVWSILFLASFLFCFVFHFWQVNKTIPQVMAVESQVTGSPAQQVQKGIELYQLGEYQEAIALWEAALPHISTPKDQAIVINNLAKAYYQIGQFSQAISSWNNVISVYRDEQNPALAGVLIDQAQVYTDLGQQRRAISLLDEAIALNPDPIIRAAALGALGNATESLGDYDQALTIHNQSLEIARELNNNFYIATALNNLGTVYSQRSARYNYQAVAAETQGDDPTKLRQAAVADREAAIKYFQETIALSSGWLKIKALMNLNPLLIKTESPPKELIISNWQQVRDLLAEMPDSWKTVYALVNLADSELKFGADGVNPVVSLQTALSVANKLADTRAISFALGSLGHVYERSGDYNQAIELTRKAQLAAQEINAYDSLYLWEWQVGRILKATGDRKGAISSYYGAIASLQKIRDDLLNTTKELQFDFRDQVEPIYRELISLLLDGTPNEQATVTTNLQEVLDTLELLKLAELQNFFGDDCVSVESSDSSNEGVLSQGNTALVYSIILDESTEMILRSPNGSLSSYSIPITKPELEQKINDLRYLLELRVTEQYLLPAQEIYELLIGPMAADLATVKPDTIVFINDGALRKIPMSALYDGQEFLIQKYAIATTPSLALTSSKSLDRTKLSVLGLALSVARPPFAPLSNVVTEVEKVTEILGGIDLINEEFTVSNFESQLVATASPIVHMATHGKFGVDADSTFMLGFDQRITIEELDRILRARSSEHPVELLTLSACQTAAGDNRSALGIAGVAVRAGVQTALATLWYINDESTVSLIQEFYTQLRKPDVTKAEAIRRAQMKAIADVNNSHPAVWSPFILIGNWL